MRKIWDTINLGALPWGYGSHWPSVSKLLCLVSHGYRIKWLCLEVNERFFVPIFLFEYSVTLRVCSIGLLLNFAKVKLSCIYLSRHSNCVCLFGLLNLRSIILLLSIMIKIHGNVVEFSDFIMFYRLLGHRREVVLKLASFHSWWDKIVNCLPVLIKI